MKQLKQKLIPGICTLFLLLSCQPRIIEIPLKLNTDLNQNFGYKIKFDKKIYLDDQYEEILTGIATGDLLVGYKAVPGSDTIIYFWIDRDRDGNLKNDLPVQIVIGSVSEEIFVKGLGKLSGYEFPFKVRSRGTIEKPYIKITSNYSFDGFVVRNGDTIKLQIWDPNSNGLFDSRDAGYGNIVVHNYADSDKLGIPITQIIKVFDNYYLLDSLAEDMSYIRLEKTRLQAIAEGMILPDFSIELINGEYISSDDLIGSWVMLDFFGSVRAPYHEECIQAARDYYNFHNDSVRLISISCDAPESEEENLAVLRELELPWEIGFSERGSDLWKMFGSSPGCGFHTPFRFLIQPDGKVRAAGKEIGKTWVGQKAPNFIQEDMQGNSICLSDLMKGKYILLDFWASWCAPCMDEIPVIQVADSLYGNKNLDVIGISWDFSHQDWVNAVKDNDMDWIQLTDLKGYGNQVGQQFGILSIPACILLNPDGRIIAKNIRGEELLATLKEVLK